MIGLNPPQVLKVSVGVVVGAMMDQLAGRWKLGFVASPLIRNFGTVGGNVNQRPRCWFFRGENFACYKKGGDFCYAVTGDNRYHAIIGGELCYIVHPSDTATALLAL